MYFSKNLIGLLLAGGSMGSVKAQMTVASADSVDKSATLYFYQDRAYEFIYPKYRVYANGKLLCKLSRNSICQVILPAGTTSFAAKIPFFSLGNPSALTLTLEPGKSYYLQGGAAAEVAIPGTAYGFTEVVPNDTKLKQIARAKQIQPLAASSPTTDR